MLRRGAVRRVGIAISLIAILSATPIHAIWPLPQSLVTTGRVLYLDKHAFRFEAAGYDSDVLRRSFARYHDILWCTFPPPSQSAFEDVDADVLEPACDGAATYARAPPRSEDLSKPVRRRGLEVQRLQVRVLSADETLGPLTDESYALRVAAPQATASARTVFGAMRALESFAQLMWGEDAGGGEEWRGEGARGEWTGREEPTDFATKGRQSASRRLYLPECSIKDAPRFPHRGLLLDSARHFLPVRVLKRQLDAMSAARLNVLHWHLTDDQAFSFVPRGVPELGKRGALAPSLAYSRRDVAEVVTYGRERGVRVVPEFDVPGHAASWGKSHPEVLTQCCDARGEATGVAGPLDPSQPETFALVWRLLRKQVELFPDPYVHVGGDEVDVHCWESSPRVRAWMEMEGLNATDIQPYFLDRVTRMAASAGKRPMAWQEAFDSDVKNGILSSTIVQVWKWWAEGAGPGADVDSAAWKQELERVTAQGHLAVLSAPWYLNLGTYAAEDWKRYYAVDPAPQSLSRPDLVLGGEACVWGEFVDETNVIQKTWPAAAAVAEVLWSRRPIPTPQQSASRLTAFRCELFRRGIWAAPLGPGFCLGEQGPAATASA